MKCIKDVNEIKGDLVRLNSAGSTSLISKFAALRYATDAGMELWAEETDGIPEAEMRPPRNPRNGRAGKRRSGHGSVRSNRRDEQ